MKKEFEEFVQEKQHPEVSRTVKEIVANPNDYNCMSWIDSIMSVTLSTNNRQASKEVFSLFKTKKIAIYKDGESPAYFIMNTLKSMDKKGIEKSLVRKTTMTRLIKDLAKGKQYKDCELSEDDDFSFEFSPTGININNLYKLINTFNDKLTDISNKYNTDITFSVNQIDGLMTGEITIKNNELISEFNLNVNEDSRNNFIIANMLDQLCDTEEQYQQLNINFNYAEPSE